MNGRPVGGAGDVRAAWNVLDENELEIELERDAQLLTLAGPPPIRAAYSLPPELAARLRSSDT